MALKTVSQYKDSVAAILSGIDLSNVDNLNGALERAARVLVQKADIPEASGIQNITLYQGVYDYAINPRVFGTAIIDIRPQGITRPFWDTTVKTDQEQFDRSKGYFSNGTIAAFEFNNGVPVIRIKSEIPQQQVIIDQMNETDGWVSGGSASSVIQDTAVYYQAPASLRFTLTGASLGTITKTLQSPLNLSSYQGVGVGFLAINIPDGASSADLDDIIVRLGSDSTNYSYLTVTQGFLGAWTVNDWLLVAFDFAQALDSNTPDWSSIQYVQFSFNTTTTITNFRVGQFFICQPSPAQILYQSAAIFLPDGTETAETIITADTDQIILNDPAYTLYEYEGALSVLQQTSGGAGDSMTERINVILHGQGDEPGLYAQFRGDNPSQELRQIGSYYDIGGAYGR